MSYAESNMYTNQSDYTRYFWDVMRGNKHCINQIESGRNSQTDSYALPSSTNDKFRKIFEAQSLFRQISTVFNAFQAGYHITAKDCQDLAQFVSEGVSIPIYDDMQDFNIVDVESWKLAILVKFDIDFITDATFDIEKFLMKRFAKNFGRAETNAFINGTGNEMPTGILHDSEGADVALSTSTITYDDVISLYFSVNPEYRTNATWLMNDETAMDLRKLKDSDGNYLWNSTDDTILGKKVICSEFMPDAEADKKPIAFGDFSYYWVINRSPISMRTLTEKFALLSQIGYLAFEFIDGKLIRPEAIKVIHIETEALD